MNESSTRGSAIMGMLLTFVGGYFLGSFTGRGEKSKDAAAVGEAAPAKRVQVPVAQSPALGPADAPVTIVEFADFECGFCARSVPLAKQILAAYPGQVRWVFKHFPLDFHKRARGAAKAALAAYGQGKFWEYHDRLFANQRRLAPADLEELAVELGLDMQRFRTAMQGEALERFIREDMELARTAGVNATPSLFVNGRKLEGISPEFEKVVREELAYAQTFLGRGVPRDRVYEEITKGVAPSAPAGPTSAPSAPASAAGSSALSPSGAPPQKLAKNAAQAGTVYQVRPGQSPSAGSVHALVTVIAFAEFQCQKSAELAGSLRQLREDLKDRLRVVFKHFPLRRHPQAWLAAEASLAAHAQGRFWPYHDRLFAERKDLSQPVLLRLAQEAGLDVDRFRQDLTSHRHSSAVAADEEEAVRFGSIGTPSLFVNGRFVGGAVSLADLRRVVQEEEERATAALRSGVSPDELYEHLVAQGAPQALLLTGPAAGSTA
jgi:protein-disulfide isomerase